MCVSVYNLYTCNRTLATEERRWMEDRDTFILWCSHPVKVQQRPTGRKKIMRNIILDTGFKWCPLKVSVYQLNWIYFWSKCLFHRSNFEMATNSISFSVSQSLLAHRSHSNFTPRISLLICGIREAIKPHATTTFHILMYNLDCI